MSEFLTPPTPESSFNGHGAIKAIEGSSVHRLTSGQVVIDLQTAVKELVENSLDAGATNIDVRFKNCGLKSIEVIDNGSGISEKDFDSIGRKHHTSKLSAFHDLMTLTSFGFRGEALSSLCALCESVTVTTATTDKAPMGSILELDKRGEVKSRAKGVKQRGTAVLLTSLFAPLPVRRKELERNIKREFSKALALLNAYALGPCCGLGSDKAVRFSVTNQPDKGIRKTSSSSTLSVSTRITTPPASSLILDNSEAALSRVISKEDFKEMEVLGQFNLGFIIVRRWKKSGTEQELEESLLDDLFIVDQHAADEKYNFETLQQTTNIESQTLLHPRPLELTASDELVALENLDVLRLNGFELEVVSDAQEEEEDIEMVDDNPQSRVHRKLRLIAQPVSKSTVFDMRDLEELIQLLHNRPTGQMVRCSKARAMFAMRACRKSFMIGMPLNKSQMSTIVTHMGTIDQPWNCPHGRPTMRHLFDMTNLQPLTQNIGVQRKVNWTGFE
ncbi:histidine kinase-like ATPase [Lentinula aff. lateritia]|uniref:Histidine kinase-like ATPase n=1 Tax=Lentinula aff. lateritia TaxID=2804960 RepID=A0ACC1U7U9_9AGAR|nr:histidine kinase-like ATPase [Lentinula aff. lateritia]